MAISPSSRAPLQAQGVFGLLRLQGHPPRHGHTLTGQAGSGGGDHSPRWGSRWEVPMLAIKFQKYPYYFFNVIISLL